MWNQPWVASGQSIAKSKQRAERRRWASQSEGATHSFGYWQPFRRVVADDSPGPSFPPFP